MERTMERTMERLAHGSLFGEFSRYQLVRHVSHRGAEYDCWMVLDAEKADPVTGLPDVIRQGQTIEETVKGLWQDKLMVARMESALAQFTAAGLRYEVIDGQVTLTQHGQVVGS